MSDGEESNIEQNVEGLSESESFAQKVEELAEDIGISPTALEVMDDVVTGNVDGLMDTFIKSDFFQSLGPIAKATEVALAGYESIKFIGEQINGVVDKIFGVANAVKEKINMIREGSFIDILRLFFSSESAGVVPALYELFQGDFGSDEFWKKLQDEGLDGTVDWLYDQARQGIIDITHESWAPIAAALGMEKFKRLKKGKDAKETVEEDSETTNDEQSPIEEIGEDSDDEKEAKLYEEGDVLLAGLGGAGMSGAAESSETSDEDIDEVINEEVSPDEVFDQETEMLAEGMERINEIVFRWLRHYTYYLDGPESDAYECMNALANQTSLSDAQMHRVGELMAESGIGILAGDQDIWYFCSNDRVLVFELSGEELDELLVALDFPDKGAVEYEPEDGSLKVVGAYILMTAAASIAEYTSAKLSGDKISIIKALGRGASWPHSVIKIMGKGAKKTLGWVQKSSVGLKIYDAAGKKVDEIKLELNEYKAFEEFRNLESKEQIEKLRNMDIEIGELKATEIEKIKEVDSYMHRKRVLMDDSELMKKYQDVKNYYGNEMRSRMKQRLRFTASLDPDFIKTNGLEADTEIIKSLGLEKFAKGIPNEPGAILKSLASVDLAKFKHLKKLSKLSGVVGMGVMVFGLFYGVKYLSKQEQKEFEINRESQEATFIGRIVDAMQSKNEFLQSLMDIYQNPFGEITSPMGSSMSKYEIMKNEDRRIAYVNQLVMKLQDSRAYAQDLMIVQAPIINAAFKARENPEEETLVINPFMSIKWDPDREEAYLIYPNDEEFIQTAHYMIDMAEKERDYLKDKGKEKFDDQEEFLEFIESEQLGDFVYSAFPYLGGFYDLYNAAEAMYRGDYKTAETNYFWGSFSVLTDPFMFGAAAGGKTVAKGAAKSAGKGAFKTLSKNWNKLVKGIQYLEGQSARVMWGALLFQMGPMAAAKLGILEQQQQYEGRHYATSEENAQDIDFTPTVYVWYDDAPDNVENIEPEEAENYYLNVVESMRTTYQWNKLRIEVIDNSTIRVYRSTSKDNSLTIKKYPDDDPYEQSNDGTGVWAIEDIDKAYDTFPQALVIANLCLDVAEVFEKNDYDGGSDYPFHADGDDIDLDLEFGDSLKFELSWDMPISFAKEYYQYDLEILSADEPWMDLVQRTLGVSQGWIVNAYNNWYRHVYKGEPIRRGNLSRLLRDMQRKN